MVASSSHAAAERSIADRIGPALILLVVAYSCLSMARDIRTILSGGYDDAAYYLKIAENIVLGHGSTLDGMNVTNGYQPLWEGVVVVLRALFRGSPENMLRLVLIVQSLMLGVAVWILWRAVRSWLGAWPAVAMLAVFFGLVFFPARGGMESPLAILVLALILDGVARSGALFPASRVGSLRMGALLGLLVLSRLDSVFVVGACYAWGALAIAISAIGRSERVRSWFLAALTTGLIVAGYLTFNLVAFGHAMPISGMLKNSFPHPAWYWPTFALDQHERQLVLFTAALALVFLGTRPWDRRAPGFAHGVAALALGVLVHDAFSMAFMKWEVFRWHFVMSDVLLCLLLPWTMHALTRLLPSRARDVAFAVLALWVGRNCVRGIVDRDWHPDFERAWQVRSYDAARWVDAHLPANAVLAMKDAGNMAYFSRRVVVNLDGVANGFAWQDAIREHRAVAFLRREGVGYFVQHAFWDVPQVSEDHYDRVRLPTFSHVYEVAGDSIEVVRANEIYRSPPYWDGPYRTALVIWRWMPGDGDSTVTTAPPASGGSPTPGSDDGARAP